MPGTSHQSPRAHHRSLSVSFLCHPAPALDYSADEGSSDESGDSHYGDSEDSIVLPLLRHPPSKHNPISSPPTSTDMLPSQQQSFASQRTIESKVIEEKEWVEIFSEMIRQAREGNRNIKSASTILHEFILASRIDPVWDDLTLPGSRSLRSYQSAFRDFASYGPGHAYPLNPMKRPAPMDHNTPIGRSIAIAPKPAPAAAVAPHRSLGPAQHSSLSPMGGPHPNTQPAKKRGRPSKKDQEAKRQRQIEGATAGAAPRKTQYAGPAHIQSARSPDTFPNPMISAHTPQRTPGAATPQAQLQTSSNTGSSSSGKRRRGRPPKNQDLTAAPPPPFNPEREVIDSPQAVRRAKSSAASSPRPESSKAIDDNRNLGKQRRSVERAEEGSKTPHWTDTLLTKQ